LPNGLILQRERERERESKAAGAIEEAYYRVPPRLLLCSHHLRMAVDVNLRINRDHVQMHCRGEKKKKIKARQMNAGRGIEELARSRVVFARKVDAATHQLTVTLGTKMAAFDSLASQPSALLHLSISKKYSGQRIFLSPLCIPCRGCPNDVYRIPIKL
jgi:hypothetical protein